MQRQIVRNISANWVCYFVSFAINLVLAPFVVRHLGVSAFGVWVLISSVVGYLGLLDVGVTSSVIRFVSTLDAKGSQNEVNKIVSNIFFICTVVGIGCLAVTGIGSLFVSRLTKIPIALLGDTRKILIIVGINMAVTFPMSIFGGFLRGLRRFDLPKFSSICVLAMRALTIIYFLRRGGGLVALATITLITNLFGYVLNSFFSFRLRPGLRISLEWVSRDRLRKVFGYSFFLFIIRTAHKIILYTDTIVIGIFLGPAFVAFYSIGSRLVEYMREFISEATCVIGPIAGSLHGRGAHDEIKRLILKGSKYSFMLSFSLGIIMILLGKTFLHLWMGPEFAEKSTPILLILAGAQMFASPLYVGLLVMRVVNRHRAEAYFLSAEAVVNLILSIILLHFFGIIGVAIGTAIPFMGRFFFFVRYITKTAKFQWQEYIKSALLPPLMASSVALIPASLFLHGFNQESYVGLLVSATVLLGLFGFSQFFLCLSREERGFIMNKIRQRLRRNPEVCQSSETTE